MAAARRKRKKKARPMRWVLVATIMPRRETVATPRPRVGATRA